MIQFWCFFQCTHPLGLCIRHIKISVRELFCHNSLAKVNTQLIIIMLTIFKVPLNCSIFNQIILKRNTSAKFTGNRWFDSRSWKQNKLFDYISSLLTVIDMCYCFVLYWFFLSFIRLVRQGQLCSHSDSFSVDLFLLFSFLFTVA